MKYSEFKRKVEEFGLTVKEDEYYVEVESSSYNVLSVSKVRRFEFDNEHACFSGIFMETRIKLFDLSCELAKTPLAEREGEKRYYLLSVSPMLRKSECGYLLYHKEYDKYYTGNTDHWGLVYQTIFTESEISQMDITGFEKIEVTDGE